MADLWASQSLKGKSYGFAIRPVRMIRPALWAWAKDGLVAIRRLSLTKEIPGAAILTDDARSLK